MNIIIRLLFFCSFFSLSIIQLQAQDWPNLSRYEDSNKKLGLPLPNEDRVVFMGNSITEGWLTLNPDFFKGKPYINRGISGQTTPQMLLRFRADVIDLKPKVVVILAGTNDLAGNTGPATLEMIEGNIMSMCELAAANKIAVVLCSVLPAYDYEWKKGTYPMAKIAALNKWMKTYAEKNNHVYVDFYSAMVDERPGLRDDYSYDEVHPDLTGYKVMEPLVEFGISSALSKVKK
ncbi:MAG: acylhydrolase [Ignavibacteriaceae bacterium]|nr:acylhydrolase [Ignavibacteriaceae bacterium]